LEQATQATMSTVFAQELDLPTDQFVVVSGPNLAKEIAREEPTATVVACVHEPTAPGVTTMAASDYFRPYRHTDAPGVDLGAGRGPEPTPPKTARATARPPPWSIACTHPPRSGSRR